MTLEALRHAQQLAFVASGENLEVGDAGALPWPVAALAALRGDEAAVRERFDSGLTAIVYRLHGAGRDWALRQARRSARVRNVDGQTSFLNEVQRRADLERLKRQPGGAERWRAIVDTAYASYRDGIIVSPWIEGRPVVDWDERQLTQALETACALWTEGLFEWDLCPGNILDDGRQLRLFDFGYMYRFDPGCHFSSAGHGDDEPLFHPAERFETRNFSSHLLRLEQQQGAAAALAAYRLEKAVALEAYRHMRDAIAARGAKAPVLAWLETIADRWQQALRGDAAGLYLVENWRSHVLDLQDDLDGQTCTPTTLQHADWLLAALHQHFDALQRLGAFFWGDAGADRTQLIDRYGAQRRLAEGWQVGATTSSSDDEASRT